MFYPLKVKLCCKRNDPTFQDDDWERRDAQRNDHHRRLRNQPGQAQGRGSSRGRPQRKRNHPLLRQLRGPGNLT